MSRDQTGETASSASRGSETYLRGPRTVAEAVAGRLRVDIRSGRIEPGTRLRQQAVADQMGVSTTPVREAFKLLQAEGVVRVDAHRGAAVLRPTEEEVRELYGIRIALESIAMRRAVERLTAADLKRLKALVDQSDTPDGDLAFHAALYSHSRWARLCSMIVSLRNASQWGYLLPDARTDHHVLLKAAGTGHPSSAAKAIEQHLTRSMDTILGRLATENRLFENVADRARGLTLGRNVTGGLDGETER